MSLFEKTKVHTTADGTQSAAVIITKTRTKTRTEHHKKGSMFEWPVTVKDEEKLSETTHSIKRTKAGEITFSQKLLTTEPDDHKTPLLVQYDITIDVSGNVKINGGSAGFSLKEEAKKTVDQSVIRAFEDGFVDKDEYGKLVKLALEIDQGAYRRIDGDGIIQAANAVAPQKPAKTR